MQKSASPSPRFNISLPGDSPNELQELWTLLERRFGHRIKQAEAVRIAISEQLKRERENANV